MEKLINFLTLVVYLIIFVMLLSWLFGCATAESYRTTMPDGTKFEAKRTGIWFAGKIKPLVGEESLEIK